MDMTRSTSPPKSSVFGSINDADTVIIPFNSGVLARIVIPRSSLQIVESTVLSFGTRVERTGIAEQRHQPVVVFTISTRDDGDVTQIFDHNFASGIRNSALLHTD